MTFKQLAMVDLLFFKIQYNLYYPTLLGEEQLVWIIEGSDNRRAKITGLNGVARVGLRSDK